MKYEEVGIGSNTQSPWPLGHWSSDCKSSIERADDGDL